MAASFHVWAQIPLSKSDLAGNTQPRSNPQKKHEKLPPLQPSVRPYPPHALIGPSAACLPDNHFASSAIAAAVVLAITAAAVRGLELGKWIHNIGGISILAVYCALIILPLWAIARHQPIHYEPLPLQLPQ